VRKVFSESLDVVVHLDRDDSATTDGGGIRRQVMEIAAVVPAMRDDFTVEPIFVRESLGEPLRWTGVVPARLGRRLGPHLAGEAGDLAVSGITESDHGSGDVA
jgi:hypothetical protein